MVEVALDTALLGSSQLESQAHTLSSAGLALLASSSLTSQANTFSQLAAGLLGSSLEGSALSVRTGSSAPVASISPPRIVPSSRMVLDMVDWFLVDGITRAQGVSVSDLELRLFFNGIGTSWSLVSGVGVTDSRVSSGRVYWDESQAGFYRVRWFPNVVGSWRLLLTWPLGNQAVSQTYEVVANSGMANSGISSSFYRQ